MRVTLALLAAVVVGLAPVAAVLPAAAATTAAAGESYVALGDSYAAGLGIGSLDSSAAGTACGRSTSDYPHLLAKELDLALTDVTCSGAVIADLSRNQTAGNLPVAPQFDALGTDTRLVTVTIGGNDLRFTSVAAYCASLRGPDGPVQGDDGTAASCEPHYVTGGDDTLASTIADTIRPALDTALATIREKAPQAAIVVVDYPAIVPDAANTPASGCWSSPLQDTDALPFTTADLPYLQQTQARLDQTLADAAQTVGAGVATVYADSLAHTACGDDPWVNGVRVEGFSLSGSSLHPNLAGATAMSAAAAPVARALLAGGTASAPPTIATSSTDGGGVPGWVWGAVAVAVLFVALVAVGAFRVVRRRR